VETPNIRLAVIGCFIIILFLCMFVMLVSYKVGSSYEQKAKIVEITSSGSYVLVSIPV